MSETIETNETELSGEPVSAQPEHSGPWKREPGRRGRLSKEERAAKAAWEGTAEVVDFADAKKQTNPKRATSLEQISQMIFALHSGLALFAPEFGLARQEADLLASSVANLGKYYNISLDGKAGAIVGLISTCGMVYGPRILAVYLRTKGTRAEQSETDVAALAA